MSNNNFGHGLPFAPTYCHDLPLETHGSQGTPSGGCSSGKLSTGPWYSGASFPRGPSPEPWYSGGSSLDGSLPGGLFTGTWYSDGSSLNGPSPGGPSPGGPSLGGPSPGGPSPGTWYSGGSSPGGPSTGTWYSDGSSLNGPSPRGSSTGVWYSGYSSYSGGLSAENLELIGSIDPLLLGAQDPASQTLESFDNESGIATAHSQDLTAPGLPQFPQNLAVHASPSTIQSPEYTLATCPQQVQQVPEFVHVGQIPEDQPPFVPAQDEMLDASSSILLTTRVPCPHCDKLFGTARDMKRHLQTACQANVHNRSNYQCWCDYTTARRDNYLRHLQDRACKCREQNPAFKCGCGVVHQHRSEHLAHVKACTPKRGRPKLSC